MRWIHTSRVPRVSLLLCMAVIFAATALGQTGSSAPTVTIGVTPLVIGSPATIQVLVTNPAYSPLPTGQVTLDFGDATTPANLSLSNTWAGTTHTYAAPGQFTLTASYSGDSNFAPAIASLTATDLNSTPVYTLQAFGDSMTGGLSWNWPVLLTQALGWKAHFYSSGGAKTDDEAPAIYQAVVDGSFVSTWLLGANDSPSTAAGFNQLQHAVLAQNAWLAIPEGPGKQRAQASTVSQTGDWHASDIYTTTGLLSLTGGSTLTATVPGNVIYLGLTSTLTTDYTVDVVIDGVDQGQLSPVSAYVGNHKTTEGYYAETYGARYPVGGVLTGRHVVQLMCVTPGTSGCYVDWIGGNGSIQRANIPPYVFAAVSYTEDVPDPNGYEEEREQTVRGVIEQLQPDGLSIHRADIASLFNGPVEPQCVNSDGEHPNACGNQIEATVFLSAANFLATEAQRIDVGSVPSVIVGQPLTLDMATATSGLPVTYTLVSGPGKLIGDQLNFVQAGTLTVEADQAGNSSVLPAQPAQFNVSGSCATTTGLTASASSSVSGAGIAFTATVSADRTPASGGSVTFMQDGVSIGSVPLNTSGQAMLITESLPVGTDFVTASYGGDSFYNPSTSASVPVKVQAQVAAPTFSVPGGTYTSAQTVALRDTTPGAAIYYTTNGSTPTTSSAKYHGPIAIAKSETLHAIGAAGGYATSAVATATYTITFPAAMPTFSVPAGTYKLAQTVAIGDSTAGAIIYYTTNGSTPATSSTRYKSPIKVTKSETLQAIAVARGYVGSAVAAETYTITPPAAMPTFSVPPGTYTSDQTVAIGDSTDGKIIYYTTNGSTPTTSSTRYKSPIKVAKSETIQAIAVAGGYIKSAVASATYAIDLPQPSFTLDSSAPGLTVPSGNHASLTLTVTPQNGFNSTVNFACSGLPANTLCSFTPAQVTPTSDVAVTTRFTIGSIAGASAARPGGNPFLPAAGLALAGCFLAFTRRRTLRLWLVPLAAIAVFGALSACGGRFSAIGGDGGGGTKPTTATITVTATSGVIHQSTQITLTVN